MLGSTARLFYGLAVYPPPAGKALTAEQAQQLDDTFLSSDPFQYFRSRIAALLSWHETAPVSAPVAPQASAPDIRAEFNSYLQRPAADGPFDVLDVHAQVAADAFALRHHAAEALLRFIAARLTPIEPGDGHCLWATVSKGSNQIGDVIAYVRDEAKLPDAAERWFELLVPPYARLADRDDPNVVEATNVFISWIGFAIELLTPADIDHHAANNKIKHGLAVRSRSDMRVTFTAQPPNHDGSIPLEALTGEDALDIFDQPVLEVLAQGPKTNGHRQGLEITQLRLQPSAMLAQAFMLAMTQAALFHVAAIEHIAQRDENADQMAPPKFPGYPVGGPRPQDIDAAAPLGLRFPLTEPPGGGPVTRPAGIGFRDCFVPMRLDYANRTTGVVVADGASTAVSDRARPSGNDPDLTRSVKNQERFMAHDNAAASRVGARAPQP